MGFVLFYDAKSDAITLCEDKKLLVSCIVPGPLSSANVTSNEWNMNLSWRTVTLSFAKSAQTWIYSIEDVKKDDQVLYKPNQTKSIFKAKKANADDCCCCATVAAIAMMLFFALAIFFGGFIFAVDYMEIHPNATIFKKARDGIIKNYLNNHKEYKPRNLNHDLLNTLLHSPKNVLVKAKVELRPGETLEQGDSLCEEDDGVSCMHMTRCQLKSDNYDYYYEPLSYFRGKKCNLSFTKDGNVIVMTEDKMSSDSLETQSLGCTKLSYKNNDIVLECKDYIIKVDVKGDLGPLGVRKFLPKIKL